MRQGLVIDVESTGPHPVGFSCIQIGAVDLNGAEFFCKMRPLPNRSIQDAALNSIGLTEEEIMEYPEAHIGMTDFYTFLMDTYGGKRTVTWSDNPAFDWQFINAYLWMFYGENPLGFSMRRIGDFYAGRVDDVYAASKWKKLRDTKHTHNALDDARGNAEALRKVMAL